MPYLKLETNVAVADETVDKLLMELSAAVAEVTGKPESVVQVDVEGGRRMCMAGTEEPTAFVTVKGIGYAEEKARPMSEKVCGIVTARTGIAGKRIYLAFDAYKGAMWGVDGRTF